MLGTAFRTQELLWLLLMSVFLTERTLGLLMVPAMLPEKAQRSLLSRMLHRDLSNPRHKTNVHMHYNVIYPPHNNTCYASPGLESLSFFSESPSSDFEFSPVDPKIHKPLSISKFMNKSLRWITLGGQYDWTRKVYPEEEAPRFPHDISNLVGRLFEEIVPQAAIVNVYSPGDTLSLHRDVSEQVDKGLVSISIGCDCLFVIGLTDESDTVIVRLRSGDAVYMSKEARFAWHGVPKIIPRTCPPSLESWPAQAGNGLDAESPQFESWRGWLSTKRINLNVRQMMESV